MTSSNSNMVCVIKDHKVELPDGSGTVVDLLTAEGMLSFLRFKPAEPCIQLVQECRDTFIRSQEVFWSGSTKLLYYIPWSLGKEHASKITRNEYETVVAYFEEVWDELQSNQRWIQTGTLDAFYRAVLLCHVAWARIPLFIKLFMERGFSRLAKFFRASREHFPCPYVSEHFLMIFDNARRTLNETTMTEAETLDMVDLVVDPLKHFVKTGMVAQALRALTVPVRSSISAYLEFVQCIMRDEELTRKRFFPDTPCGRVLAALLNGTDGWKPHNGEPANPDLSVVMERLKALQKRGMSEISPTQCVSVCDWCDKVLDSDKKCGRCKKANYCSRECQKADWKEHKKVCRPGQDGTSSLPSEIARWLSMNYVATMTEVSRVTRTRGIAKKDVVVVVDLKMEHPAIIATPYADLVDGDAMPNWGACMENPDVLAHLQMEHRRMTSDHLLVLYRNDLTDVSVYRPHYQLCTGLQLFSDDVLSKFPLSNPDEASAMLALNNVETVLWAHQTFGPNDVEIELVMSSSETMGRQG